VLNEIGLKIIEVIISDMKPELVESNSDAFIETSKLKIFHF
jgi:hypothetical protein